MILEWIQAQNRVIPIRLQILAFHSSALRKHTFTLFAGMQVFCMSVVEKRSQYNIKAKFSTMAIWDFHNVFKFNTYYVNKRLFLTTAKLAGACPT